MKAIERLEAVQFYEFTRNGYSRPARLGCIRADGSRVEVYVKFLGGVEQREFGLAAELICSLLARELGLSTPTPFLVDLSPDFLAGVPKAARDLVNRSLGLNFGTECAPLGFSVVPRDPQVPPALRSMAAEVFALDVLLRNLDRKSDNPNLLWDRRRLLLIDHERALAFVRDDAAPSVASLELDRFYDHVFYSAVTPADASFERLESVLGNLAADRLEALLGKLPAGWQVEPAMGRVRVHLSWVVSHRAQVCDLIRKFLS